MGYFEERNILAANIFHQTIIGGPTEAYEAFTFLGFCLIFIALTKEFSKKTILAFFVSIFFIIIAFLIGERANFIKIFLAIILLIIFINKINLKHSIIAITSLSLIFYLIITIAHPLYKWRYHKQLNTLYSEGLSKYLSIPRAETTIFAIPSSLFVQMANGISRSFKPLRQSSTPSMSNDLSQ